MDKWTELRTAYWVAKLGTVSATAEALGFHRATINRHIDVLEAEIGSKIFIRHARGYALTETGQDVLRVAQKTDELIEDLAGRVHGGKSEIEGEIKLTILAPFAGLLMGAVMQFRLENPRCLVNVDVGEDLAKLEYGEAHIAVRAGAKPEHPDYVVAHLGDIGIGLYAHDSYAARCGLPADESDLAGHSFVLPHIPTERFPLGRWIKEHIRPEMIALSSRDVWLVTEAVFAGAGIGIVSDIDAGSRGGLQPALLSRPSWSVSGWLVTHVDLHRTEKVQAMLRCLKASAAGKTVSPA
ncbi:DNA-binding transcriptional regulator, LysR family [Poseidonocella pacifica]|uniref:DNA-binding transcriptional regulator, LysR family n=1 Tax=Poseidonocella pacifica TaxID=871651 RepID=A0A1I0UXN2_9RHOB|nr:LysR family transcriptional regulator [Poseidonocella pacifica]SFA68815.1 DNA-binding transcriptional regulator, LysR family [Poseidonocella pacifica]